MKPDVTLCDGTGETAARRLTIVNRRRLTFRVALAGGSVDVAPWREIDVEWIAGEWILVGGPRESK
jgi:hypothetical protein